jgi:patatin-like phospholipase/acyl hydrolase
MIQNKRNLTRPRRLLSLDGGGIRGIIPAQILLKIENLLCNQPNSPWKCLGDYFDFIGGTSTGSIIAAGLAKGMKVQDILDVYTKYGKEIFSKRCLVGQF